MQKPLFIITGPTASGKSSLGLKLAQAIHGAIICADSRQIYREFDIGTATPSAQEMALAPHYLFNLVAPTDTFTVAAYVEALNNQLNSCWDKGEVPIIVGGTGLYINSFLYGYSLPQVPPQQDLRDRLLAEEAQEKGVLHRRLKVVDPQAGERIHVNDLHRTVRALEVFEITGETISSRQNRSYELLYPQVHYMAIATPKEKLYERIQARIQAMIDEGLIEEVKALIDKYGPDLPLLKTLNYVEIQSYLKGELSLEQAQEKMFIQTRQYAKRQRTWFKKDPHIHWYSPEEAAQKLPHWIAQFTKELAP